MVGKQVPHDSGPRDPSMSSDATRGLTTVLSRFSFAEIREALKGLEGFTLEPRSATLVKTKGDSQAKKPASDKPRGSPKVSTKSKPQGRPLETQPAPKETPKAQRNSSECSGSETGTAEGSSATKRTHFRKARKALRVALNAGEPSVEVPAPFQALWKLRRRWGESPKSALSDIQLPDGLREAFLADAANPEVSPKDFQAMLEGLLGSNLGFSASSAQDQPDLSSLESPKGDSKERLEWD